MAFIGLPPCLGARSGALGELCKAVVETSDNTAANIDATIGAKIYYTIDGSEPTRASTEYTGSPITIGSTATLRVLAMAPSDIRGARAIAIYRIVPLAARPVFTPPGGACRSAQTISITDATPGATVYYTTDGTTRTTASTPYTGPIAVSGTETLQAIALAPGRTQSGIASATYVITQITETVIHSFSINDANLPSAGLMQASDGNFYGTTQGGGAYGSFPGNGTVFRITPAGRASSTGRACRSDP